MAKKRSYTKRRSSNGFGRSRKLPVAVIAGLVPGFSWSLEAIQAGNWQGAGERLMLAYAGIKPSPFSFTTGYLGKGLYPLMFGYLVHTLATRFGVNRALGKLGLPVEV